MSKYFFLFTLSISLSAAENSSILKKLSEGPQDLQTQFIASYIDMHESPVQAGSSLLDLRLVNKQWRAIMDAQHERTAQEIAKKFKVKHPIVANAAVCSLPKMHELLVAHRSTRNLQDQELMFEETLKHLVDTTNTERSKKIVRKIIDALDESIYKESPKDASLRLPSGVTITPHRMDVISLQSSDSSQKFKLYTQAPAINSKLLALQSDKIIYAGSGYTVHGNDAGEHINFVASFNQDGSKNTSFANGGIKIIGSDVGNYLNKMCIGANNQIVLFINDEFEDDSTITIISADGCKVESMKLDRGNDV